jgi:hypothetical protein
MGTIPKRRKYKNRLSHLFEKWWALQDSNLGPTDYESAALTAELRARGLILLYLTVLTPPA